ncbi:hypothetical protein LEP1GSC073_4076 [Leptospira noguchii str. Cascata]|nr:hypothetical protein LEP1GSC073_4076 [Leptospira noguchii str. Cascata]
MSSGERFALVHSSIPFALGRTHVNYRFHKTETDGELIIQQL